MDAADALMRNERPSLAPLQEPNIPTPNLDFGGAVLSPILPHASGFQILTTPITAIGIGKALLYNLQIPISFYHEPEVLLYYRVVAWIFLSLLIIPRPPLSKRSWQWIAPSLAVQYLMARQGV